jgi:hypothetical protein
VPGAGGCPCMDGTFIARTGDGCHFHTPLPRLRLAASGDFGARWALWVPWVTGRRWDCARRHGGGNARLMAGEPNDNLAAMDSWPAARVPELPGQGPETVVWDTASGRLADAPRGTWPRGMHAAFRAARSVIRESIARLQALAPG